MNPASEDVKVRSLQCVEGTDALAKLSMAEKRGVTANTPKWARSIDSSCAQSSMDLLLSLPLVHGMKQGCISPKISLLLISAYTVLQMALGDPDSAG